MLAAILTLGLTACGGEEASKKSDEDAQQEGTEKDTGKNDKDEQGDSKPAADEQDKDIPTENDENNKHASEEEKPYTEEQEKRLLEVYDNIIEESKNLIVKIEQERNYEMVYVTLADDFTALSVDVRKPLIYDWGHAIQFNTQVKLFYNPNPEDVYVYFVNSKGAFLAETNHLEKGWTVK